MNLNVSKWLLLGYGGEDQSKSPPHAQEDSKNVLADVTDLANIPDDIFDRYLSDQGMRELGKLLLKTLKSQDKELEVLRGHVEKILPLLPVMQRAVDQLPSSSSPIRSLANYSEVREGGQSLSVVCTLIL